MSLLFAVISQTSVFVPLSIGIFISTAILHITDLAIDGSFLLGAATFTLFSLKQYNPLISLACAMLAGSCIGLVSAFFQRHGRIQPIIAGMLAVLIAHGAFFFIVGSTNVNLYSGLTFSNFIANTPEWIRGGIPLIIALCVAWSVNIVLSSCLGLAMRTFGSNPNLLSQLGKSSETYRTLGLALSNGAAGISGALTAQQNGYADVSMGFGVTLIGIATVLIGAHLIKNISGSNRLTTISSLAGCFLGAFIYFLFIRLLLISGISPLYLKSVFALVLGIGLYATSKKAPTTL